MLLGRLPFDCNSFAMGCISRTNCRSAQGGEESAIAIRRMARCGAFSSISLARWLAVPIRDESRKRCVSCAVVAECSMLPGTSRWSADERMRRPVSWLGCVPSRPRCSSGEVRPTSTTGVIEGDMRSRWRCLAFIRISAGVFAIALSL